MVIRFPKRHIWEERDIFLREDVLFFDKLLFFSLCGKEKRANKTK